MPARASARRVLELRGMSDTAFHHEYADVNGTRLHYVRAGEGPLIVFLHGFPQGWFIFRRQLEEFARDHTAVAVDLRGYGLSAKPEELSGYGTWVSAEDTKALAEHLGFETFTLVGHDTGGAIAYSLALHHPELLERMVILTTPHPALFDRELHENREQVAASAYMLAVRRPGAADALRADDFAVLRAMLDRHEYFDEEAVRLHLPHASSRCTSATSCCWRRTPGTPAARGCSSARASRRSRRAARRCRGRPASQTANGCPASRCSPRRAGSPAPWTCL